MKVFSTFSGIGGFEKGIQQANIPVDVVGFSEIDKYASSVYEYHLKGVKTQKEREDELTELRTNISEKNYDIISIWKQNYANAESHHQISQLAEESGLGAESAETSTAGTDTKATQKLKSVSKNRQQILSEETQKKLSSILSDIMLCEDKECSICTGESVFVAESLKRSSSPLNTETETEILTESDTELAICINSPSKITTQKNTKSYATTVITLKGDMAHAHIKRTKPIRNFGDITKINADELPDFDCLVGGFPCQAFSIAGKRKGFEDTRGTLFFDLARILRAKRPRLFVFENVKGLLSHEAGRTFKTIIQTIDELGYDCQWQVLNSKNHGVPQNRERVYIVGHLRGSARPEVFPIESDHGETSNEVTAKGQLVDLTRREPTSYRERNDGRAGTLDANYYKGLANQERPGVVQPFTVSKIDRKNKEYTLKDTEVSGTLTATMWKGIDALNRTGVKQLNQQKTVAQRGRYNADGKTEQQLEPRSDDISGTLTAVQKDNMVLIPEATKKGYAEATVGQAINLSVPNSKTRRGRASGIAPTLDTWMQLHTPTENVRIRRLTPVECERLQGFPDDFTKYGKDGEIISDSQRYKMCGNAVTTNVVQAVFEKIFETTNRPTMSETTTGLRTLASKLAHDFNKRFLDNYPECFAIGDEPLGTWAISDQFWTLEDMALAMESELTPDELYDWYWETVERQSVIMKRRKPTINLKSYIMGARYE